MESIFGKNIKKFRLLKNLTQKQLAELLDVKHQSVEKWEKGETMPTGKRLILLVEALGITQNQLYESIENSNSKVETVTITQEEYNNLQQALTRENELLRELAELRKEKIKTLEAERIEGGLPHN